jgi:hypothetical protein
LSVGRQGLPGGDGGYRRLDTLVALVRLQDGVEHMRDAGQPLPRQSALSLAMREIGRIERTVDNLDWIEDKGLRADTTDVLNKGEARHTLSRAVAFHQLGRFRDRSHERQSHRAAALNLATACIGLFNCRYLDRAVTDQRRRSTFIDDKRLRRLSPLGWDHINLTGDYGRRRHL